MLPCMSITLQPPLKDSYIVTDFDGKPSVIHEDTGQKIRCIMKASKHWNWIRYGNQVRKYFNRISPLCFPPNWKFCGPPIILRKQWQKTLCLPKEFSNSMKIEESYQGTLQYPIPSLQFIVSLKLRKRNVWKSHPDIWTPQTISHWRCKILKHWAGNQGKATCQWKYRAGNGTQSLYSLSYPNLSIRSSVYM